MQYIEHTIELHLNSTGYKAEELQELLPDFITERHTVVGLTWYPSANGPESFTLAITIGILLAEFGKEFVKNLSKDLYEWTKNKIVPLLQTKNSPEGIVIIKFKDAEIRYFDESKFSEDTEKLSLFIQEIPHFINKIDSSVGANWSVRFDNEKNAFVVEADKNYDESEIKS
jgi:hypothetical protein